ncbi:MAG: transposase [Puniceicoccales bacterium]|nr:transposase [Puniceicoccales bacterium]
MCQSQNSTHRVFGFKLHLAIDGQGKPMAFRVTKGNRHGTKEAENSPCKFRGTVTGAIGSVKSKSDSQRAIYALSRMRAETCARRTRKKKRTSFGGGI